MHSVSIRRHRLQWVFACALVLALVWGTIAYQIGHAHDEALKSARQEGDNITSVVAAHFSSFAGTVDSALQHLRLQWVRDARHFRDAVAQEKALLANTLAFQVEVVDAGGWLAFSEAANSADRVFLGDQDYFRASKDSGGDRLQIGRPEKGRLSDEILVRFTRAITGRNGAFAGVTAISISPQELNRIYRTIDLGPGGVITLRHLDNTILVRSGTYDYTKKQSLPEISGAAEGEKEVGSFVRASPIDGIARLFSYRRMPDYPLIVIAGQSLDAVLADYYDQRRAYVIGGVMISLMLVWLMLQNLASLRRDEQVDKELRESEARYRGLSNLSADAYWEQDSKHRFTLVAPTDPSRQILAQPDWLGKTRWELPFLTTSEEVWRAHRATLDRREPFRDLVLDTLGADGQHGYFSISGHPVFDAGGKFTGYRGTARNISAAKRAEQLLVLEHAVTRCLAEAETAPQALIAVLRAVCETEGWQVGRHAQLDKEAGVMRFAESWSVEDPEMAKFVEASRGTTFKSGAGLVGRAWQSGQPLWSTDTGNDPRVSLQGLSRGSGIRGAFVFPVVAQGETIGVLAFSALKVREPDERLLAAARVIGSQIGQFLRRKQLEEVMSRNETRLRTVTDNVPALISYVDTDERYQFVNKAYEEWFGRTVEETIGKTMKEILGETSYEERISYVRAALRGERVSFERHVVRSGRDLYLQTAYIPEFDESNKVVGFNILSLNVTDRKQHEERLESLALHDSLTGLANRRLLVDRVSQAISHARRNNGAMAVLYLDLDGFKQINDTLGHDAGDVLLKAVAERLVAAVRQEDTVARPGGDEFVIVLWQLNGSDDAVNVAAKVVATVSEPYSIAGRAITITTSAGVGIYPGNGGDAESLMKSADLALYEAKHAGKNAYRVSHRESLRE